MQIKRRGNRYMEAVIDAELNDRDKKLKEKEKMLKQKMDQHDAML